MRRPTTGPKNDRAPFDVACIPIGNAWTDAARRQFRQVRAGLPARVRIRQEEPTSSETGILDRIEGVRASQPAALLLPALHGGSARALLLAATRGRVPAVIWCHDEKHSLSSACLAREALRQLGRPVALVHGHGAAAVAGLAAAIHAAAAMRRLADARIGRVGSLHPNLVSRDVDPLLLHARFGSWVVPFALADLRRRVAAIDARVLQEEAAALRSKFAVSVPGSPLGQALAVHLVLDQLAREHRVDSFAVDCWNEVLPEFGATPCMGFAFDGYQVACEGDLLLAVALLAGEAISGGPGFAGDLYSLREDNGHCVLVHCGACAALHSVAAPVAIAPQEPPSTVHGKGTVVSCRPVLPRGPGTLVQLHGRDLDRLHLRRCRIASTRFTHHMEVHVRIEGDAPGFRAEAAGNHYALFPGDWIEAWRLLAQWLGVTVH